jgi:asparagine synthase (glutamine-hydrolysing)
MSEKYWKWLPDNIIHQIPKMINKIPNFNNSVRRIKKALEYINLNENERINSYFYWMNPENLNEIYSDSYKKEFIESTVISLIPNALGRFNNYHPLNKMLYMEMRHFLADHNLNYTDKMGMSEGVEIRVPLLDKDIVNFALNLPIQYKYNSSTKWIFKEALKGIVPKKILYRKKSGFGAPLRYWLKNDLDEIVRDTLSKKSINNRGIFNYDGVHKLMNNNKVDSSYTIFSMICMELWFRKFVD